MKSQKRNTENIFLQKSNWRPRNVFTVIIFTWIALLKELILAGEPMSTWHDGSPDWAHAPPTFLK